MRISDWSSDVCSSDLLRALERSAREGLERLHDLEKFHRNAQRAIVEAFRPGALPRLLALTHHRPLLSPQGVADALALSVAGASKLLERAAATSCSARPSSLEKMQIGRAHV